MAWHIRDEMIPALLFKHEMHMAWPIRMAMQQRQELAHGPVVGNGIRHRPDGLVPKVAVPVAPHHASPIRALAVRILHVVMSTRVRLPNVDLDVRDRRAVDALDTADAQQLLALRIGRHDAAVVDGVDLVRVDGAEDRAFGGAGGFGVVDRVDEQGQAHDVGEEDELLRAVALDAEKMLLLLGRRKLTWRTSVHICPVAVKKSMPAFHSLVLSRVSRAKSWRCVTRRSMMYFMRGLGLFEFEIMAFSVMLSAVRSIIGGSFTTAGSIFADRDRGSEYCR